MGNDGAQTLVPCPPPSSPESAGRGAGIAADDADALPLLLAAVRHGGDRRRPPGDARARSTSRPTAAACARRAGRRPSCSTTPSGCSARWSARRPATAPARWSRPPGTTPSTGWSTAIERTQARVRPRRRRLLRRRLADQRAGLPVRQVRPGRAAHQRHRLQRPLLHVLGRRRGQPRLRPRPRHAVPAQRHRRGRRRRPGRQQPGRHDAAGHAVLRRRPRARRPAHRRRPAAHRHRPQRRPCTCSRCPAPTSRWPTACCTSRSPRAWSTRTYVAARTTGFDDVRAGVAAYWPDRVERITGVPGRRPAAHRLRPRPGGEGDRPHRPRRRAAPQRHRHRPGVDQPGARPRAARPAGQRLGHRHRPGQRAGRPRARAEGRPAARLPLADRPGRPRARRRRLGHRPRRPADAREVAPSSCSTRSAPTAASARCSCWPPTSRSAPPTPAGSSAGCGDLDFLAVSDFFLSETAELADVVLPSAMWAEEDGTMTNLEGRVIRRRRALDPPDRRAATTCSCWPTLAERLGAGDRFSGDPETVFEELRRASAGGAADYSGISYRADRRRAGRLLAVPGARPPRHAAAVHRAVRHPRRPGPLPARRARRRPRAARRRLPLRAHHRPGARPVPVRHADPPHPQPAADRADPARRAAPRPRPAPRHRRRTTSSSWPPAAAGPASTRTSPTRSGPTSSSRPSTGAAAPAPTRSPTPRSTRSAEMPAFKVCAVAVARVGGPDERIARPRRPTQPQPPPAPATDRPRAPHPVPDRGAPA